MAEHDGDINGFMAHTIRMPDDGIFVAVLSNNEAADPEQLAFKIAAITVGRPYQEPEYFSLLPQDVQKFEGVYRINTAEVGHITCENNRIFSQHGRDPRVELVPFSPTEFYFKNNSCMRITFIESNGIVAAAKIAGRSGIPVLVKKIQNFAT